MTFAQSQRGLLMISNDSFLVGLLKGYSAAGNFYFSSISSTESLTINSVNRICRVILYDQRSLEPVLIASHIQMLERINSQYGIPVCAIYNQTELGSNPNIPWVNYLNDNDLIDQLDRYITNLIVNSSTVYNERRNKDRREYIDRRRLTVSQLPTINENIEFGPFEVDRNSHTVYCKTQDLALTAKEFKLFMLLAEVHDHVCSTETIIARLWPNTPRANKSDLYQYMHLLRKKVEDDPDNPRWILTVKGVGYSLNTKEGLT
jgi:DNA-binding winged helix-turn-helix (wHTH) protein